MSVRAHAQSFRVTATSVSKTYKLPGRPESLLEVINLGKYPVYARLGDATAVAMVIGAQPTRSVYLEAGSRTDLSVDRRTHIALLAPDKDCEVIVMQGSG